MKDVNKLKILLKKLKKEGVRGIGIVVVCNKKVKEFLDRYTLSLRPSFEDEAIKKINSDKDEIHKKILKIHKNYLFHDGFIILNNKFKVVGISRSIIPDKKDFLLPDERYGNRFYTAKLISADDHVIASGIIESDGEIFYFVNGLTYKLDAEWDKVYKKLNEYNYYKILEPHEDLNKIIDIFRKKGVRRILDLGCGAGRNLIPLAKAGFEVHGIDLSETAIHFLSKLIRKINVNAKLKIGNIYDPLPYPNEYFDAIISIQVLQHGTRKQIEFAIKEMKRILKKGGIIFVTVCGRYSKGKTRYCLVKTAKQLDVHTYIPQLGKEKGLTHFIFNKKIIYEVFKDFKIKRIWKDKKDYYCVLAMKK